MQTLNEIRDVLNSMGLRPRKQFGQCFLIDKNLMRKLLELARVGPDRTVLEVGPGTGSLTEELLEHAAKVVAVEIDRDLAGLLRQRLAGRKNLVLICGDVLAGKHAIAPEVLAALGPSSDLVANLPYQVATPLVAECLKMGTGTCFPDDSGRGAERESAKIGDCPRFLTRFCRLTFTVQREVADRMTARPGGGRYGPISVLVSLLGRTTAGPAVPASAFWPRPKVESRILRIDFDAALAGRLADVRTLERVLSLAFGQRRKQIGSVAKRKNSPFLPGQFEEALLAAGVDPALRAEEVSPEQFRVLSNALGAWDGSA